MKKIKYRNGMSKLCMIVLTVLFSACGKQNFSIDSAPADTGLASDSSSNLVDTTLLLDGSKLLEASIFPGLVCDDEPRLKSILLNMDFNYKSVGDNLRISVVPKPLFSTGYYAAPGELITIDVPAGQYQLSVQIGGWTDDLSSKANPGRDAQIVLSSQLAPGRNYVRNLYGGPIYINSATPQAAAVPITLGNVVKSPDFVLGKDNNADWKKSIQASCVPFLELRSKYIAFLVPREKCLLYPIADIEAAMRQWDSIIVYDYNQWEGLSLDATNPVDQAPLLARRVVFDIDITVGYGHSGFPVMVIDDYSWFSGVGNVTNINSGGNWGFFHELGHNEQQSNYWSWSTLGETSNNLFSFKVSHRLSATTPSAWPPKHEALATAFPTALAFAGQSGNNFDTYDFGDNAPFCRLTPFVQIFDYIKPNMAGINKSSNDGWAFMGELYSLSRRAARANVSDLAKHDFVYRALCNFTQYDWALFFKAWGITISDLATTEMSTLYTPIEYKVWQYNPLTRVGGTASTVVNPYTRTSWSILSYSSQQLSGETTTAGVATGLATAIIDGDTTTFWHSNYSGGVTAPPHTIVIDLGATATFSKFYHAQRNSLTRKIKSLHVDVSSNGSTWSEVSGSPFALSQTSKARTTYNLTSSATGRYVRLRVATVADTDNSDGLACIAEFGIVQ